MRLYRLAPIPAAPVRTTQPTYASSLTDPQWALLAPLLVRPRQPTRWPATQARAAPYHRCHPLPGPYRLRLAAAAGRLPTTEHGVLVVAKWVADGTLDRVHDLLRDQVRRAVGRHAAPTAAIIDSQSVRAADTVARHSRGYDAGKKVNGRKRHLAVDTCGLLLLVMVTAASVQDRDAARPLLWRLRARYRPIRLVWADAGYAGRLVAWARDLLGLTLEIVRKHPGQSTFEPLPRRWVVERTLAWISKHRRTVRDYERLPAHHAAMVTWAMIAVMTRRLARHHRHLHQSRPTSHNSS